MPCTARAKNNNLYKLLEYLMKQLSVMQMEEIEGGSTVSCIGGLVVGTLVGGFWGGVIFCN